MAQKKRSSEDIDAQIAELRAKKLEAEKKEAVAKAKRDKLNEAKAKKAAAEYAAKRAEAKHLARVATGVVAHVSKLVMSNRDGDREAKLLKAIAEYNKPVKVSEPKKESKGEGESSEE